MILIIFFPNFVMKLLLDRVSLYVSLGTHPWEKAIQRLVWINVSISSKELIDYDLILECITSSTVKRHFDYIEDLGKEILAELVGHFAPTELSLEVIKPSFFGSIKSASAYFEYNGKSSS